jgi:hypothetical protein
MGAAVEVPIPMEPAHIKPVDFLQRGACPLPPIPPARTRTTHLLHSCRFLVEIIREIYLSAAKIFLTTGCKILC